MPRPIRTLAAGVALVLLLASCSLVEDLVPPQQVNDPLGLHDVPVTLEPTAVSSAAGAQGTTPRATTSTATTPQATTTYEASFGPAEVSDIDTAGIPDWFDPDSLSIDVGFMPTVRVASVLATDGNDFGGTLTLDSATLADFTVVDAEGEPRVDLSAVSTPAGARVTLIKQDCAGVVPLVCTYEAQTGLEGFVIPVFVGGTAMDRLYAIITGGAPTNTASGALRLTATGTVPSDATITVTMDAPSGTLDP